MHALRRARSRPALVIGTCGILAAATTAAAFAQDDPVPAAPSLTGPVIDLVVTGGGDTTVDLGGKGRSPGDVYAFRGTARDSAGNEVGRVLGTQTTIRLGRRLDVLQGLAAFDLPEGQIVIGGRAGYPDDMDDLLPNRRFERPVLGGTGIYAGVGGVVTTRAREDGSIEQRLELTGPPAGPTTVVDVRGRRQETLTLDLPPRDEAIGDLRVFAGKLARPKGRTRGTATVVREIDGAEIASAAMTFQLPGGQLVVNGLAGTPVGGGGLLPGRAVERAVVGGSGRYAGMAGTVTTTRSKGGYRSRFELFPAGRRAGVVKVTALQGPQRTVDVGRKGVSPGDLTVFAWPLAGGRGNPAGVALGAQTSIRAERGGLTVNGQLTYALRRGDLVVGGMSSFPRGGRTGLRKGRSYERPVLGGTGAYAGMRGELRSIRTADGTYRQVFRLRAAG